MAPPQLTEKYGDLNLVLGQGSTARVFSTIKGYAVKKVRFKGFPNIYTLNEAMLMNWIKSEYLLPLIESFWTPTELYLVLPLAKPVPLELEPLQIWENFRRLVLGVYALHSNGLAHRDLKLENLLYLNDKLVLADFGHAQFGSDRITHFNQPMEGFTPGIGPPEDCLNDLRTQNSAQAGDLWSLGVLLFQWVVGKDLFRTGFDEDVPYKWTALHNYETVLGAFESVSEEFQKYRTEFPAPASATLSSYNLDSEVLEILEGLLCYDPKKRWTITELIQKLDFNPPSWELAPSFNPTYQTWDIREYLIRMEREWGLEAELLSYTFHLHQICQAQGISSDVLQETCLLIALIFLEDSEGPVEPTPKHLNCFRKIYQDLKGNLYLQHPYNLIVSKLGRLPNDLTQVFVQVLAGAQFQNCEELAQKVLIRYN